LTVGKRPEPSPDLLKRPGVKVGRSLAESLGGVATPTPKRGNKYRAKKQAYRGVLYDSIAEARRAEQLDWLVDTGQIRFWVRQVVFRLGCPENVYRCDFLVIGPDGAWCEDVKGFSTAKFARDKRLWRSYGPFELCIIRDGKVAERITGDGGRS
jgi:hypothetical protein